MATLAQKEVSLPASSSLATLDAALQLLQGEGDILTLMQGPDYPSVDLSFSAMTPILMSMSIFASAVFHALTMPL